MGRDVNSHTVRCISQHFLIGKPLEKNGQDSFGPLTSFTLVNDADLSVVTGVDPERAEGFLIDDR